MSGLQTIVNKSNNLQINRRKVIGIQLTRNEIPRTSFTPTKNPWRFTLEVPSSMRYSEARALMEELDTLDRYLPQIITFNADTNFSWMFAYQGELNTSQINSIVVQSFVGNQLTLNVSGVTATSTTILFKKNDLIQIGGINAYPYPFTSTTDVFRGSGNFVTVTTHRPNILTGNLAGLGIRVGNDCQFNMFCINMPVYRLIVGGTTRNDTNITNNALIEFSDPFEFFEYVGSA